METDRIIPISALSEAQIWLNQFDNDYDKNLATQLLDLMCFVETSEVESYIYNKLKDISETEGGKIAVHVISSPRRLRKLGNHPFGLNFDFDESDSIKKKRRQYGSEDIFGTLISGFNGLSNVVDSPTLNQIKSEKIKTIVLFDDILGSGTRTVNYWRSIFPKSIKSLLSYGRMNLYLVYYTSNYVGLRYVKKVIKKIPDENVIINIQQPKISGFIDPKILDLCKKYGKNRVGVDDLGFKGTFNRVLFGHGIPNNTPDILHRKSANWKPLFDERRISPEIKSSISNRTVESHAESLWSSREKRLAISMLNSFDAQETLAPEGWSLITWLAFVKKGMDDAKIAEKMFIPIDEVTELRNIARSIGIVGDSGISDLGTAYLIKFRNRFRKIKKSNLELGGLSVSYYPSQCEGKAKGLGNTV